MFNSIRCQWMTSRHDPRSRALIAVLLVAAALHSLLQPHPPANPAGSSSFFPSGDIHAISFTSASRVAAAPATSANIEQGPTLFGNDAELIIQGELLRKWSDARLQIARELHTVDRCRRENECPAGAQRLINLSAEGAGRSGRAKLGFINRAVDLAITPTDDEAQWRVPDYWSTPLETLRLGRGDCEDYAIVKYAALLDAGISEADLKIVLLRTIFPNEDHAVVAARVDGEWLILDNRTLTLVRDINLTRAVPVLVLDHVGFWRFIPRSPTPRMTRGSTS